MGIESKLAERKGKELFELPKETKTKTSSKSKRSRRRQRKMSPIQKLFETCTEVFASCGPGIIPPHQNIEKLRAVLDSMKPEDVGLKPEMPYFRKPSGLRTPPITYLHLYECDKFSMGIFCMPPSAIIPLHNHPGMTVFSKILFGTMNIKSYDWVVDLPQEAVTITNLFGDHCPEQRLAKVKVNADFTAPCGTSILYPADGGNMHCFTALTSCAVLDVLGPPYSDPDGRDCTYYIDYPFPNFSVEGLSISEEERENYAWLQEREKPEDLMVVGALYGGPKILD